MKLDHSQVHTPQSLGERIAHERRRLAVREGRDILPPQLAQLLDVSGESVYKWETGGTVPSRANIQRLAALFGVSPAYLEYGVVPGSTPLDRLAQEPEEQARPYQPKKAPAKKASAKKGGGRAS